MKHVTLLLGAGSLAFALPVAVPAPVHAQKNSAQEDLAFCRDVILPSTPETNLGRCMGFNRSSEEGFFTFICQYYRLLDPIGFEEEFDTFGECVEFERSVD